MNLVCFTYIFELAPNMDISLNLKLPDMKSFLVFNEDMAVVDKLTRYDVPLSWEILSHGSVSFLCIALKKEILTRLGKYASIFAKGCAIPHLTTLLRNGINNKSELITIQASDYEPDIEKIAGSALAADDIYIINGRTGAEKKAVLRRVINGLLGLNEKTAPHSAALSLAEYKNLLQKNHTPPLPLSHRVEYTKMALGGAAFFREKTLEALDGVYQSAMAVINADLLQELNQLRDGLRKTDAAEPPAVSRLLAVLDGLPENAEAYRCHGIAVTEEAVARMELLTQFDLTEAVNEFKVLMKDYDGKPAWFDRLHALRNEIAGIIKPDASKKDASRQKKKVIRLLTRIHQSVLAHERFNRYDADDALTRYAHNITQELIDKYINHDFTTRPFIYKGTAVIDTDTCTDDAGVMEAITQSKKIIMAGSYLGGLYKIFFEAAIQQQRADRQNRLAIYRTAIRQHPKLAAFIQRNFDDLHLPDSNITFHPKSHLPVFIWLSPEAVAANAGALLDMLASGLSVGMVAPKKEKAKNILNQLQREGSEPPDICAGNEQELHGREFDVLFLLLNDGKASLKTLYTAMVMATHTVIIVGEYKNLEGGSILRKFYCLCEGDRAHGRVYH
jgi:hypothetical protein